MRPSPGGPYGRFVKRVLDMVIVLFAAPFVLPVVLLLGALVARDGGPAFYVQDRVGRGGRVFRIWKLRSMVVDAERRLEAHLAAIRRRAPNGPPPRSSRRIRASPRSAG